MEKIITDQNYKEFFDAGLPLVIDFSATWCGPCKKIGPIIEELSTEYEGKVNICKCDVDDSVDLTGMFGIRNVPTVVFIKDSAEVKELRHVGAAPKTTFVERIEALLK